MACGYSAKTWWAAAMGLVDNPETQQESHFQEEFVSSLFRSAQIEPQVLR
jgi:hypothetical protein